MQLFVNDLTVMDFSYLCPIRGVVGESWIVDVVLDGALNEESMIEDFSLVKKNLKRLIDQYVDHKLLVPVDYQGCQLTRDENDKVEVVFTLESNKHIALFCPDDAYAFIYAEQISQDSVGAYVKEIIATHLPNNVNGIHLNLRTEVIDSPYYHYTHGLKKHDGNCQRIAHGHRSRIDIYRNGKRCTESEKYWSKRLCDIYIASDDDQVAADELTMKFNAFDEDTLLFAYESSQGRFELAIAKEFVEIIFTDSTVECLADFIHAEQTKMFPHDSFKVVAYEGVGKGAMVG